MLRWRFALGIPIVAALVLLFWLDHRQAVAGSWPPGALLGPLALAVAMAGTSEWITLVSSGGGHQPVRWIAVAGSAAVVVAAFANPTLGASGSAFTYVAAALALMLVVNFAVEVLRYVAPGGLIERIALSQFAILYVGMMLVFVVRLRFPPGDSAHGLVALASLILTVKASDTGAYTVGRLFGRRKLAPRLSPGKSIEGAVGGLVAGCGGAWLSLVWLPGALGIEGTSPPALWRIILFGLVVTVAGIVGDLAESLIKRDVDQKDSSQWMPGFGGVLDLLDSILLAAPVAYVAWESGWIALA